MPPKRPEPLPERIGQRLRELRKSAGLTQAALAEKADLSVDFIGRVERGVCLPSLLRLEMLAKALNVSVKEFFGSSLFYQ